MDRSPLRANSVKVVTIREDIFLTELQREIAELAFEYWLARFGVQGGSPEDDFHRAEREVMARTSKSRTRRQGYSWYEGPVHEVGDCRSSQGA